MSEPQYEQFRKTQMEEICRAFGAPPSEVIPQAEARRTIREALFALELEFVANMLKGFQEAVGLTPEDAA